jgi:hypothetical protein
MQGPPEDEVEWETDKPFVEPPTDSSLGTLRRDASHQFEARNAASLASKRPPPMHRPARVVVRHHPEKGAWVDAR